MFYGWRIVGATFVSLFISVGFLFYSYGVFFPALEEEFGGTRFAISTALAIMNIVMGLVAPFLGRALDERSIRSIMLIGASLVAIGFMLMFVIPVFQDTYDSAGVPLPGITLVLLWTADMAGVCGPYLLLIPAFGVLALKYINKTPALAVSLDRALLRIPLLGPWLRDMAVLQFMDVLSTLLESGFTVVEALGESANAVGNRAVQECIRSLEAAVRRGERFSRELVRYGDLFPPVVGQLVIIGEKTGNLSRATRDIRTHLRREIERKTNIAVGTIEPVLTISLATLIGVVLLAIYLPMFDMISTMG